MKNIAIKLSLASLSILTFGGCSYSSDALFPSLVGVDSAQEVPVVNTEDVKSGDSENTEARAAAYYWKCMYAAIDGFARGRDGLPPNNLLNYGYAVLRAVLTLTMRHPTRFCR